MIRRGSWPKCAAFWHRAAGCCSSNTAVPQERLEPLWKPLAGGCNLTRPVGAALRGAGFAVEPLGQAYLDKAPRVLGWMEWGVARKA